MISWRDVMAAPPEITHPQNPQNRETRDYIAHSADIADRITAAKVPPVASLPTQEDEESPLPVLPVPNIQPGDRITWQVGTGGTAKNGVVDFLHTYHDEVWAFCTIPDGGWTAVNVKYIRKQ